MKILLTDAKTITNNDLDLSPLSALGELELHELVPQEELAAVIAASHCDAMLCNKSRIGAAEMDASPNLKYIGVFATGYNNIDVAAAAKRGICVSNAGTYSSDAVCQTVFSYILAYYSRIAEQNAFVQAGGWKNSPTFSAFVCPTHELAEKTIGIVGYGSIGKTVARVAHAFGMQVLVTTRTPREDASVSFLPLGRLLASADIVTVHCPLTPESAGMFDYAAFCAMKRDALFINTSRGGTVVEADLRRALEEEKIGAAAVDVLCTEPMSADCPLLGAKNLTITPHSAWAPIETRRRLLAIVTDCLRSFLEGAPKNKVN